MQKLIDLLDDFKDWWESAKQYHFFFLGSLSILVFLVSFVVFVNQVFYFHKIDAVSFLCVSINAGLCALWSSRIWESTKQVFQNNRRIRKWRQKRGEQ